MSSTPNMEGQTRYMRFETLADALDEIALHYRLEDRDFIARQYTKASEELRKAEFLPPDPARLEGVGDAIRDDIAEWRAFGEIDRLTEFREKRPYLSNLCELPKVGPKTAKRLYQEKDAVTIADVQTLADNAELEDVSGIGPKTAETIRRSLGQR